MSDAAEIFTEDMPESLERALPRRGVACRIGRCWTAPSSARSRRSWRSPSRCAPSRTCRARSRFPRRGRLRADWAIAFNEGAVRYIYFVAGDERLAAEPEPEGHRGAKIECARKLFEQLGEDDVRYDFVSTYEELLDKVMS